MPEKIRGGLVLMSSTHHPRIVSLCAAQEAVARCRYPRLDKTSNFFDLLKV